MSDNYTDVIPERDIAELKEKISKTAKITRSETEDRLLCSKEENILLKKHLRKQEDRIKQLATRLVRVIGEKSNRGRREDLLVEDQKVRIMELELQIRGLKDKLSVYKAQLTSYTKLVPSFHHIPTPKSSTKGASKSSAKNIKSPKIATKTKSPRSITSSIGHPEGHSPLPHQVATLLLEAQTENSSLHNQLKMLHKRWVATQQELMAMKEQLTIKEVEQEDEMLALRTHMETEQETNKMKLADNIQLIRLQRDVKRTASWLATYEAQCKTLEATLVSTNENLQQAESQLATTQDELREEQARSLNLLKQVEDTTSLQHKMRELEAQIVALQDENKILKQANDSLVSKALESTERVKRVENQDDSLKNQINHLENTIRVELQAKSELISALSQEKAKSLAVEQNIQTVKQRSESLMEQLETAKRKLHEFEAQRQEHQRVTEMPVLGAGFCDKCVTLEAEKNQTQWQLIQVQDELVKTKNLLKTQISINKEYHKEIDVLSSKLEKAEVFHNEKLEEFMKIFEEKTSQMSLLEKSIESFNANARAKTPPYAFIPCNDSSGSESESHNKPCTSAKPEPIAKSEPENIPPPLPVVETPSGLKLNPEAPVFIPGQAQVPVVEPAATPVAEPEVTVLISAPPPAEDTTPEDVPMQFPEASQNPMERYESKSKPTLRIDIERFIPRNEEILPTLFMTWEHPDLSRNYTPIVSNGIFHSSSTHSLTDSFKMGNITVELHQAIGTHDSRCIGKGVLDQNNSVAEIRSSATGDVLGQLVYSCLFTNLKPRNGNNNPTSEVVQHPEPTIVRPPIPVPRKVKPLADLNDNKVEIYEPETKQSPPVQTQLPAEIKPEVVPENVVAESQALNPPFVIGKPPPPKKSILRKDVPGGSPRATRHVTVNETIEERRFESGSFTESPSSSPSSPDEGPKTNYTEVTVEAVIEREPEPKPTKPGRPSQVPNPFLAAASTDEPSSDSQSIKRRIRRRNAEETETDLSTASFGSETSRNISELEDEDDSVSLNSAMRIEVSYVVFKQNCRIWTDARIKKFFIEYRFLNYPSQDLETEMSLPKPQPGRKAEFNWVKVFAIDTKEKQRLLRDMLERQIRIQFTLVSEPAEDDAYDCEDIGYAYVSLNDILQENADIVEEEIMIFDAENTRVEIGVMCVSVQALTALKDL